MTLSDRAEIILLRVYGQAATHNSEWFEDRDWIESELRAAVDEALKDCGKENCMGKRVDGCATWVREERLVVIRNEALEKAAKICDAYCHCAEQGFDCDTGEAPAPRIRALIKDAK